MVITKNSPGQSLSQLVFPCSSAEEPVAVGCCIGRGLRPHRMHLPILYRLPVMTGYGCGNVSIIRKYILVGLPLEVESTRLWQR